MMNLKNEKDISLLRELAKKSTEISAKDAQDERRAMWRSHNSFGRVRPPVVIRGGYEAELLRPLIRCEDDFYREFEFAMRACIMHDSFDDDFIMEPWINLRATCVQPPEGVWGVSPDVRRSENDLLAFHVYPALKTFDDMKKMAVPVHSIDEKQTAEDAEKINEAIGDIIDVYIDRSTIWKHWNADISTQLGYLRGHEQMLYDMMDNSDELHKLLAFMRDGILKAQAEAECAGDWTLCEHENQSVAYVNSLADPKLNSGSVKRKELWAFVAAQEFAGVSPELHYEFLLQYQMPIMENFGLIAYGCCEDLTNKIDMLRKVKNLRRISVTPFADAKRCAEQIKTDYICAYRPNPSLVAQSFDSELIGKVLKNDMDRFAENGCFVDICLKDISTVGGDPERLKKFTQLSKQIAEEYNPK